MLLPYISSSRNLFKEDSLLSTIEDVAVALSYSADEVRGLLFERSGECPDSNMTSWGLHTVVREGKLFQLSQERGLMEVEASASDAVILLSLQDIISSAPDLPCHEYAVIDAIWCSDATEDGVGNNILGESVRFVTDRVLRVPLMLATNDRLAYYGAQLLQHNDIVHFPIPPYPIWAMSIGENYVRDCLLTEKGAGWYIEYHTDKPHFHMPLSPDCRGFYLLAKHVEGKYHISAFSIPHGSAVYTAPGALHCDAGLIGSKYMVGYDISREYSTANMKYREEADVMTRIEVYQHLRRG